MSDQLYVVVGNRGFEPSDTDGVVPWLWESSEGAKLKADHLNKFESTKEYYPAAVFIVRKEWVEAVQSRTDELDRLRAENERLRAAIKPFADCVYNDNGDVTIDTSHLKTGAWVVARAVILAKGGKE